MSFPNSFEEDGKQDQELAFDGDDTRGWRPIELPGEPEDPADPRFHKAARLQAADALSQELPYVPVDSGMLDCPLPRFALEVRVVDEDDHPIPNTVVELQRDPTSALTGKTGVDGRFRFERLVKQPYSICLPEVDAGRWQIVGSEPLKIPKSSGDAVFDSPAGNPTEEHIHAVKQGESVSELALRYGFTPEDIWNATANAPLRQKRKDKNILNPGDTVVIPKLQQKLEPAEVSNLYLLRRIGPPEVLRVRFLDSEDKPRQSVPYFIEYEYGGLAISAEGKTDPEGFAIEKIPADVDTVNLFLGLGAAQEAYAFQIAHLDPADTITGVRERLINLGYDCGDEDDRGQFLRQSLVEFQRDYQLDPTGEADDATMHLLEELHLS